MIDREQNCMARVPAQVLYVVWVRGNDSITLSEVNIEGHACDLIVKQRFECKKVEYGNLVLSLNDRIIKIICRTISENK